MVSCVEVFIHLFGLIIRCVVYVCSSIKVKPFLSTSILIQAKHFIHIIIHAFILPIGLFRLTNVESFSCLFDEIV